MLVESPSTVRLQILVESREEAASVFACRARDESCKDSWRKYHSEWLVNPRGRLRTKAMMSCRGAVRCTSHRRKDSHTWKYRPRQIAHLVQVVVDYFRVSAEHLVIISGRSSGMALPAGMARMLRCHVENQMVLEENYRTNRHDQGREHGL